MDNFIVVVVIIILVLAIMSVMSMNYSSHSHPILNLIKSNLAKIDPKYGAIPFRISNQSATHNKKLITLCIFDENGAPYDINTLMYVALHEVAHTIDHTTSTEEHHTPEFIEIFAKLIKQAAKVGVYNPNSVMPKMYCGQPNR